MKRLIAIAALSAFLLAGVSGAATDASTSHAEFKARQHVQHFQGYHTAGL